MTREGQQLNLGDTERLRRAFAAQAVARPEDACPAAEELYDAGHGALASARMGAVLDHVMRCAECAEAWRLLLEVDDAAGQGAAGVRATATGRSGVTQSNVLTLRSVFTRRTAFTRRVLAPLAAAAGVLLAVGLLVNNMPREAADEPQYRASPAAGTPRSLVGNALPRARLLLRWSASGADASYTLRVTTTSLEPLLIREKLRQTEYLVPASALTAVATNAEVLWQVEVLLPGGRREASESYVLRVR